MTYFRTWHFLITAVAALAISCVVAFPAVGTDNAPEIKVEMRNVEGAPLGTVSLIGTPNGVLLRGRLAPVPAGAHGFHIHETGVCDPRDSFRSAGDHLGEGREHGFYAEGGPHPGDMPNIHAGADNVAFIEVVNDGISLQRGTEGSLVDGKGTSLVVHAKPDDYASQPSGDAGDRIACGVIKARH